ncbi:diacylglycerol/lipid kinase family protein [Nocardioides aequoreus]|uniref:diacylglycerol/lipid kinase family protein n=1 Tax=Nocardioides aequoreus TaxID=397278 RepID=UPI0004C36A67|nr:diacylglycerol kinase family protein [Nocardioides aequoreus]
MEPVLVIANAEAGGEEQESLRLALEVLRAKADVEVARTSNPGELDGVLHRAGGRLLVAAGGDGSLHAVVAALHKRRELGESRLGLLPLGTGNDFARTLGLPLEPQAAAEALLTGRERRMDLIVDELGQVVVNSVHLGASAQASRRGARWKRRLGKFGFGILGYPIGAVLSAVRPPYVRLRIEVDGEVLVDVADPVLMVAVGNGTSVGGGTELTPEADPGDARLDVMVSRAIGPLERFGYVWKLTRGTHEEREDVLTARGRTVTVSGEEFYLSADGEIDGPERRRTWRLEPAAYRILVPGAPQA